MAGTVSTPKKRWAIAGLLLAVVAISIAFLGHNYLLQTSCEGIFQQAQLNLRSSIEMLQVKGEIGFENDKVQELTEKAQLVALNYKACCVAADNGLMPENEFLECKKSTNTFESKVAQAAQRIQEARAAKDEGEPKVAERKSDQAAVALKQSEDAVRNMPTSILVTRPSETSASLYKKEQEPNNDLFQSNPIGLTSTVSGELSEYKDVDAFRVKNSSSLRDWVSVKLENKSQNMAPEIEVFDANRRSIIERYETTKGANMEISFVAEAAEDHYVIVRNWTSGSGPYVLKIEPMKYYDEFEPNDDASQATPLSLGKTVEATILDNKDSDWYQLHAAGAGPRKISLKNIKGRLKPEIAVLNSNKSNVIERYDTTEGANLEFSVDVPTSDFYVRVTPWSGGWGQYLLTVE